MRVVLAGTIALGLASCTLDKQGAKLVKGADISNLRSFYVVQRSGDDHKLDKLIVTHLKSIGYKATSGPRSSRPAAVGALVTYRDSWTWDMSSYMVELDITIRDPKTYYPLAIGNSQHGSLTRLSPEAMVKEVLTNIFKQKRGV
jgi:hypothetical protein